MKYTDQQAKSAARLKEVLVENRLKQAQLAEMIGIEPNMVSMIVRCKRTLTQQRAQMIVRALPDRHYRAAWLLGIDDYKTEADIKLRAAAKEMVKREFALDATALFALSCGYSIQIVGSGHPVPLLGFSARVKEALSDYRGDCMYEITGENGEIAHVGVDEYHCFINDIREYVEFKTAKLIKHSKEVSENG